MIEIPGLRIVHGQSMPRVPGRAALALLAVLALAPSLALAASPSPAAIVATTAAARPGANPAALVPIYTPSPEFPERARRARISGYVVVTYTIGTDGHVGNVRVVESSPKGVFERSVETTLARWRYQPLATAREVTHTFDFDQ